MIGTASAAASAGEARVPKIDVYEEKAFGFWLYLMSDAIIFALLFATFVVMAPGTAGGPTGKMLFSLPRTFAETMGHRKEAAALQRILEQEASTNEKLTRLAERRVNERADGGTGRSGRAPSGMTKDELYAKAQELDIEGRSAMTKEELEMEVSRRR